MTTILRTLAFAALALGCSCRLPVRGPDAERIRRTGHHHIHARQSADGTVLRVRFSTEGRDAWATAELGNPAESGGGGHCALTLSEPDSAARQLGKKSRNVPVLSREVWENTKRTLASRLAPADASACTLLTAGGRETVARRLKGEAVFSPLAERPRGVRVVRRLDAAAVTREILAALPPDSVPASGPVLLATGKTPEFLFIDRAGAHICYLTVPARDGLSQSLRGGALPGEPALRQVVSLTLRSGLLGLLTNPFTTASRSVANVTTMTSAAAARVTGSVLSGSPSPLATGPGMDLAAFERHLDTIVEPAVPSSLRFLIGGGEFFPEFIQGVQEAKQSIDIQLYIFDNDDYAVQIADLLRARSREVRVRVLMDEMASLQAAAAPPETPMPAAFVPPRDMTGYLTRGVPLQLRPMTMSGLTASHQKIIILDKQRAWLGGMNIGREYRSDWHDMMIDVRGPLVAHMQRDFSAAWAHAGFGGDFTALWRKVTGAAPRQPRLDIPSGAVPVRPLRTGAWTRDIVKAQLAAVRRAKRYIYVENAYMSDSEFIHELILARHRGVDVRVILPRDNDNGIMAANNRSLIPDLRREGVRVYLLPGMSHVKAAIIDGWACTGSANYDRLSLRVNNEFNIGFSHPAAVGELKRRLFDADFRRATEVGAFTEPAPAEAFYNSVIQSVAGQL